MIETILYIVLIFVLVAMGVSLLAIVAAMLDDTRIGEAIADKIAEWRSERSE